jgi:hypothetical protein
MLSTSSRYGDSEANLQQCLLGKTALTTCHLLLIHQIWCLQVEMWATWREAAAHPLPVHRFSFLSPTWRKKATEVQVWINVFNETLYWIKIILCILRGYRNLCYLRVTREVWSRYTQGYGCFNWDYRASVKFARYFNHSYLGFFFLAVQFTFSLLTFSVRFSCQVSELSDE